MPNLKTQLETLAHGSNKVASKYANLALFQLDLRKKKDRPPTAKPAPTAATDTIPQAQGHIMLSYPWSHQKLFLYLKGRLQQEGYTVWMDVDQMSSSVLGAMADGAIWLSSASNPLTCGVSFFRIPATPLLTAYCLAWISCASICCPSNPT